MHKSQLPGYWHGGAEEYVANKCKSLISAHPLDPTKIVSIITVNNVNMTIARSNWSPAARAQHEMSAQPASQLSYGATARHLFGTPTHKYINAITIATLHAIADTGAMSMFIIEGTPAKNIWPATKQLMINLPNGSQVKSTQFCNIIIPGLPSILTGHIVARLLITSLIGICVLCKAGCKVVFTKNYCNVIYNNKDILWGTKDPSTNLCTLPLNASEDMIHMEKKVSKPHINPPASWPPQIVVFAHSVQTRANAVKFAHQLLCNPKILMLLKATRHGFLTGFRNINE